MFSNVSQSLHIARPARVAQGTKLAQHKFSRNMTTFKLNTGAEIPALGFGTWRDRRSQEFAVTTALKTGYRHIDTAHVYGSEAGIGYAIEKCEIPRDQLFLTTKLWNNSHHPDDVEKALDESLHNLNTDYVDLYLMHWPSPFARSDIMYPLISKRKIRFGNTDYIDTYKAMEKCVQSGKAKAIGVSNFSQAELVRLMAETKIVPAVHQIELHPYLQQPSFVEFHKQYDIHITQYSPFGNQNIAYKGGRDMAKLIDDPVLVRIGKKHDKSGAQIALAWGIAKGRSVIPKSITESRIQSNFQGDFELPQEDVAKVDRLDRKLRFNDQSKRFGWNFFADLDGKLESEMPQKRYNSTRDSRSPRFMRERKEWRDSSHVTSYSRW